MLLHPAFQEASRRIQWEFPQRKLNLAHILHDQKNYNALMARRSLRLTPFTRFLLIMIIVAPLAFMGAAYYNGEDGWAKLKQLVGIDLAENPSVKDDDTTEIPKEPTKAESGTAEEEISNLKKLVGEQELKIKGLMEENEELRNRIEELEKQLTTEAQ